MVLMNKLSTIKCIYQLCFALLLCISVHVEGQNIKNSENISDNSAARKPTAPARTAKDSTRVNNNESASSFGSQVNYNAKDSIVFDMQNKNVYLYGKDSKDGKTHVDYSDSKIDASYIRINYTTNVIFASGAKDSSGKIIGKPVFVQGKDKIYSDSLAYDFKTKKGKVYNLFTQEGEGYIHIKEAKMEKVLGKQIIYARDAKYTTCNLPEDPHFYITSNSMKLMANDKVITGPAYMVIEDVPIPLVLPFGFFPANSRQSSGIILPSYGESATQGFGLLGGGYYFGGNQNFDAKLTGDIYTEGNYKIDLTTRYKEIYAYTGNFNISYARNQIGLAETPGATVQENYQMSWSHRQDVKANPGTSFSASVNAATPSYFTKNSYDLSQLTSQTLNSSINYSRTFQNTPFNLSVSMSNNENFQTKAFTFDLPDATLTMNRLNPFKKKTDPKKHWYDEINFTYSAKLVNHLATSDSTIKTDLLNTSKYRSGLDQEIPISASFKVFNYFTLTPSINNSIFLYDKKFTYQYTTFYDPKRGKNIDTTVQNIYSGIYEADVHSGNLALGTTIYGMYKINRGKLIAFRHTMTPTLTATYMPDYSDPRFKYYGSYLYNSYRQSQKYSYYYDATSGIGSLPQGRQGAMQFSLNNTFELKVRDKKDSVTGTKKIKILDYLNLSTSYNFLADSLKLAPINISTAATPVKNFNIQANAIFDPYYYDKYGNEHKEFDLDETGHLGQITSGNLTFGTSLNHNAPAKSTPLVAPRNPFVYYNYPQPYASFDIPWNVHINYNANYNGLNKVFVGDVYELGKPMITHSATVSGDISLTKNWKITYQSGYDFTTQQATVSQITIFRDLHCWAMSFQWIPFGAYRSYFFNIHVKASTLSDLKLDKRKQYYDF